MDRHAVALLIALFAPLISFVDCAHGIVGDVCNHLDLMTTFDQFLAYVRQAIGLRPIVLANDEYPHQQTFLITKRSVLLLYFP